MEIPRHWRLRRQRYALIGEVCDHCGAKLFPPRDICPHCGVEAKTVTTLTGVGEVYAYTMVRQAPAGFTEQAPYAVALVKLDDGPMVTAQLTDLGGQEPYVGMRVEMVTRKLRQDTDERGLIIYGYKFRPVLETVSAA